MEDRGVYETIASLSEYEKILSLKSEFIKVHRGFIVNIWK